MNVDTRLDRAKDRMLVWIQALPEALQSDATAALDYLIFSAKAEIQDAYGDGYRHRKDETNVHELVKGGKE